MPAVQTTYTSRQPALSLGMIVNQELHNSTSRIQQDAVAVGFGRAMFRGTGSKGVTATPSAFFEGITIRDLTVDGVTADTFPQNFTVPLARFGVIAVQGSVAVTRGDPVYVTGAGAFTNVVGANTLIAGATFDDTTTAAGLVPVRLK